MRPDRSQPALRSDRLPAVAEAKPTEISVSFDDNRLASLVLGQYDENLAKVERRLGVIALANGNHVTIKGPVEACEHARLVLANLSAPATQRRISTCAP